jgi:predicted small lipoprotein YifL
MNPREAHHFKNSLSVGIILAVTMVTLSACGSSNPLYGKWIEPNSGVQLEINNNGTIHISLNGSQFNLAYTLEDPNTLILAASKDGSVPEQRLTYIATDKTLTLSIGGVDTVFDREK